MDRVRRKVVLAAALAVALGAAPSVARTEEKLDRAAAARGQVIFKRYCVACHGPTGKGDGSLAAHLREPVPDITTLGERNEGVFPYERIVKLVDGRETARAHGTPDMPAWGDAFQRTEGTESDTVEEAIRRLAHHIWSLQKPPKK